MSQSHRSIWNIDQVKKLVTDQSGQKVTRNVVSRVLRARLNMRYKLIKRIPFSGNLERNKVLRSLYAQKMIQVLRSAKRIINIDQTWI